MKVRVKLGHRKGLEGALDRRGRTWMRKGDIFPVSCMEKLGVCSAHFVFGKKKRVYWGFLEK